MTPPSTSQETQAQRDARELERFGYAQELLRSMGGFSNFAISFSIISILTGAVTLFDYGLQMGGPLEMTLGWPLATVGTLFVALSMAELCSALPTSGGTYHWSAELGGPTWAWFTALLNIVGLVTVLAGIDYGCAQFLAPILGLAASNRVLLITYALILASHGFINHYGIRWVAWLNDLSVSVHILGRSCPDRRTVDFCSQAASELSFVARFLQHHSCALCLAVHAGTASGSVDLHRL